MPLSSALYSWFLLFPGIGRPLCGLYCTPIVTITYYKGSVTVTNANIAEVLATLRRVNRQWPTAVVGSYTETPFTVLIACILSLRTQDKTTDAASARLFKLAKTPQKMLTLSVDTIRTAIYPVGFYNTKAKVIHRICRQLMEKYDGRVPDTIDALLELPGVGRKTANLTVTLGFNKTGICVDTHVHRITNRWGYVRTRTPEETEMALRRQLPVRYWIQLNELLVTYGQNICQPISPKCTPCRLRPVCPRIGVRFSR
jgi:endonuclease III